MKTGLITLALLLSILKGSSQNITGKLKDSLQRSFSRVQTDSNRIHGLLNVADFIIAKPGELKKDLDSAAQYIEKAKLLNASVGSSEMVGLILISEYNLYRESGQADKAKEALSKAINLFVKIRDNYNLGLAYLKLSDSYNYQNSNEIEQKIHLIARAKQLFRETGHIERMAYSLKAEAELNIFKDANSLAVLQLDTALKSYQSIQYKDVQSVYELLGRGYFGMRDFKKSLSYELLALKTAESFHDTSMQMCEIYNSLGQIFSELYESQNAANYFKKALDIAKRHNDINNMFLVAGNLTHVYLELNQPVLALAVIKSIDKPENRQKPEFLRYNFDASMNYISIYIALKQFDKAKPYINHLLSLSKEKAITPVLLSNTYQMLAKFYIVTKQYQLALNFLEKTKTLNDKIGDPIYKTKNSKLWFVMDTTRHDFKSAVYHITLYHQLKDSMFNANLTRQINDMHIAYETTQKEKNILALQNRQQLAMAELANANRSRNFYLISVVMLIVILGIGVSLYRIKQQKNVQLEKQKQEIANKNADLEHLLRDNEWLLREVHHRVKNNLQIVMSLLTSQSVFLKDEAALNAVLESQHRVQAMSLIHQKLYKNNNISSIYMPDYVNDLLEYLQDSYQTVNRIFVDREVSPISLDVLQAIPVGLILNETVTNAIKYAFPNNQEAVITVKLNENEDNEILLQIFDNGIGLSVPVENNLGSSFGMTLIQGLIDDLQGSIQIISKDGTCINATFKKDDTLFTRELAGT
jgi:two-component sensor histidine kinase